MAKLYNLARMTSATVGAGTATLGVAVVGYLTFALAGVVDGDFISYGIKDGSNSEVGYGKYTAAGTTLTRNVVRSTNANAAISLSGTAEIYVTAQAADFPFPDNWLSGLILSNDGVTPATVLDIAAGAAADTTNIELMRLTSAITKTTSAWAVGTGNGGLDTGAIAATTWYHLWLIRRPDTGVVDALFSLSATAPTMPTNYTQKRRVGAVKTDGSSHFLAFTQTGNRFIWAVAIADVSTTTLGTTPALFSLSGVPTGVKVVALYRGFFNDATAGQVFLITSPDEASSAVDNVLGNRNGEVAVSNIANPFQFATLTDTSARIRAVSSNAGNTSTLRTATYGWEDSRGRDG